MVKISTNHSPKSKVAEDYFKLIIGQIPHTQHVIKRSNADLLKILQEFYPDRFAKITSVYDKGLLISLPKDIILDKLFGIDYCFLFNGKVFAVDVGSGKSSTLVNKARKFNKLRSAFSLLDIDHAIVFRYNGKTPEDIMINNMRRILLSPSNFLIEIRIP